jgi:DegV family protein with EDD domain
MQIVTDTGMDLFVPPDEMPACEIHVVRHTITLDGKTYYSGLDIQPDEFYALLAATGSFPITSQPSAGDFAETYRRLAATDPDILSIHMSSGLSGTVNAAIAGAGMVPEASVTIVDTKTLSVALGWQVAAAARAMAAGWAKDRIVAFIERIGAATDSAYTLDDLKYLIHGGRISHMKGLIASLLNMRPLIGVEKVGGTYSQLGQARTFKRAVEALVKHITEQHAPGSALRAQVGHSHNPEGAVMLREEMDRHFLCSWLPMAILSPVLGAHTGPSMVGLAYAPQAAFAGMP